MWLAYKTDNQHSYASRDVIGVCSTKIKAIHVCTKKANKDGESFTSNDTWNLENLNQTQGYLGDGEFDIEEVNTNQLV